MCPPRKPADITGALTALTSIATSLSSPLPVSTILHDMAAALRAVSRQASSVEIINSGVFVLSQCALPRHEPP